MLPAPWDRSTRPVLDDRGFVVQDKATGKELANLAQHEFWLRAQATKTLDVYANDPRLLYDPIHERWFAWVQGLNPAHGYLAVSASSDPTGTWRGVKMHIPPHSYGARIGFDRNGLYISVHNGSSDLRKAQTCHAIPMADVIAPTVPDVSHMQSLADLEIEGFRRPTWIRKRLRFWLRQEPPTITLPRLERPMPLAGATALRPALTLPIRK